jgi:hypothetical protein
LTAPSAAYIEIAALAGLGLYMMIGVIATGVTAQFCHHFEVRLGLQSFQRFRLINQGYEKIR